MILFFLYNSFIAAVTSLVLTLTLISLVEVGLAQVRSSTNYQLQSDSVNIGGGGSASDSYQLESTIGEVATGRGSSTEYQLAAGFQQMQASFISLSVPNNVTMVPSLPGFTGGTSTGSTTVTVITDSAAGYQLVVYAEGEPAMQSLTDTISDYVPEGGVPDFTFIIPTASAAFGYSVVGAHKANQFRSGGEVCGAGMDDILDSCWVGLATTSAMVAQGNDANQPTGTATTIQFQVGIGSGANLAPGNYIATTTLSAIAL